MRRVNEALREVLSEGIGDLKDPRIGFVTVTGVETSRDLRHATVYISVLGSGPREPRTTSEANSTIGIRVRSNSREGRPALKAHR
jgi:ribosome-binding factor A